MLTALIVEDEPLMREYLMMNLNCIHCEWTTKACARDGVEAMSLLNESHYDVVITDIKMPRMSGIELANYIHENIANTDVIFLTGYDEFDYARTAVRAGVADYLLKPLQNGELHNVLDRLAVKRNHARAAACYPEKLNDADNNTASDDPSILVQRARDYIKQHFSEPISLNEVAEVMQVNPAYLSSIFKSRRGETYTKYILRLRMERAALLLRTYSAGKVNDIALECGYLSTKHFDAVFKKYYSLTPMEYRLKYGPSTED